MNYARHILFICSLLALLCCKKAKTDEVHPEIKGVNFNLLLKTVDKYTDGESTTVYTYNNYQQLMQENSVKNFTDGTQWKVNTLWFRNYTGQPDSMTSEYTYGNNPTGLQKQYYHYSAPGKLDYSILFRNANSSISSVDSCVFFYSGSLITKRLDYTSAPSTILNHTLTHEMFYQYDSSNNITSIVFVNYDFSGGTPAKKDTVTLSYTYDRGKNPFYQSEAFYSYYADLSFENYVSKNNIVKIKYAGNSTSNDRDEISIQYNVVNKPDRVLTISYGIGNSKPIIWSTDYYYD